MKSILLALSLLSLLPQPNARTFLTLSMTPLHPRVGQIIAVRVTTPAPRYGGIAIDSIDASGLSHRVLNSGDFRARHPSTTWTVRYTLRTVLARALMTGLCGRGSSANVARVQRGFHVTNAPAGTAPLHLRTVSDAAIKALCLRFTSAQGQVSVSKQ